MRPVNRRIVFEKRPLGLPDDACFRLVEGEEVPEPGPGRVLVRVSHLSIDPAMRAWMDEEAHDFQAAPGRTMLALGVGRVLESGHPDFRVGDTVQGPMGVQEIACVPATMLRVVDESIAPASAWLGALGLSAGITSYVGMIHVGEVRRGDTVVVSGAAGAVGSIAGQIARIAGARVVGIAGGPEKARYVVDELGCAACIDYKAEDVHERLGRLAPEGVDLYFDNVGGAMLDAVLDRIAPEARVVICGAISQYNHRHDVHGPRLYLRLAERNARMLGFTVDHHAARFAEAEGQLARWLRSGELRVREHVEKGLESYPATLRMLFDGGHTGKLLLAP
ncbi:MAG: NADP-dependent oxidoreductase [Myxococcota bacterium]|nr:NADP-dependent oxidoreductase [Myxococcota bacterium]